MSLPCGNNANLDNIKNKTAELDSLLEGGKDALSSASSKLSELTAELNSFKPELPEIPSLPKDLIALANINNPLELLNKISTIKNSYGAAVPDLGGLLSKLGLDSFPPSVNVSAICDEVPNVEIKPDGTVKEEPKESKPAEVVPPEPKKEENTAPVEPVSKDAYEYNKYTIEDAYSLAKGEALRQITKDFGGFFGGATKASDDIYFLTTVEMTNSIYIEGGGTYDEIKGEGKLQEYRDLQAQNKKAKKAGYDFKSYNSLVKTKFDMLREKYPTIYFPEETNYTQAATDVVARGKAKLAT